MLSRMAKDYLSIPGEQPITTRKLVLNIFVATSVDVEHVFSKGQILLSHLHSHLLVQSTRALIVSGLGVCWVM